MVSLKNSCIFLYRLLAQRSDEFKISRHHLGNNKEDLVLFLLLSSLYSFFILPFRPTLSSLTQELAFLHVYCHQSVTAVSRRAGIPFMLLSNFVCLFCFVCLFEWFLNICPWGFGDNGSGLEQGHQSRVQQATCHVFYSSVLLLYFLFSTVMQKQYSRWLEVWIPDPGCFNLKIKSNAKCSDQGGTQYVLRDVGSKYYCHLLITVFEIHGALRLSSPDVFKTHLLDET